MTDTAAPFGSRYAQALSDAALWHHGQFRKRTDIPYVSHLLAVSAFVLEDGGDEDEAIAGLLHDSIEDTPATAEILVARYGERVAGIVTACTDDAGGDRENKEPWWSRKVAHIGHVAAELRAGRLDLGVARVTAADKLANMRSTLDAGDHAVFTRFKAGVGGFAWYHDTFGRLLVERLGDESLLGARLQRALDELALLVADRRATLGARLSDLEQRLASVGTAALDGHGVFDPWPWFALDLASRTDAPPNRELVLERWASWFAHPLPSDAQGRSGMMDVLSGRAAVQQVLSALR